MPRFYCGKTWLGLTILSAALGFLLHWRETDVVIAASFIVGSLVVSVAALEFVCGSGKPIARGILAILSSSTLGGAGYATLRLKSLYPEWHVRMLEGLLDIIAATLMVGGLIMISIVFMCEKLFRGYVIVSKSPDGSRNSIATSRFSIADILAVTLLLALGLALLRFFTNEHARLEDVARLAVIGGMGASWLVAPFCALRMPLETQTVPRRTLLFVAILSFVGWTIYYTLNNYWGYPLLHLVACLANYGLGRGLIARRYEIRGIDDEAVAWKS